MLRGIQDGPLIPLCRTPPRGVSKNQGPQHGPQMPGSCCEDTHKRTPIYRNSLSDSNNFMWAQGSSAASCKEIPSDKMSPQLRMECMCLHHLNCANLISNYRSLVLHRKVPLQYFATWVPTWVQIHAYGRHIKTASAAADHHGED